MHSGSFAISNTSTQIVNSATRASQRKEMSVSLGEPDLSQHIVPSMSPTLSFLTDVSLGVAPFENLFSPSAIPHFNPKVSQREAIVEDDVQGWSWLSQNSKAELEGKKVHVVQVLHSRNSVGSCRFQWMSLGWLTFVVLPGSEEVAFVCRVRRIDN
jgi:hypothetical protein